MRLFDYDSPLMRFLSTIGDIILLNLLYILTCLPLITIGAANTALFYTADQLQEYKGNLIPNYFLSFKSNFKKSTLIWLAFAGIFALLLVNYNITKMMPVSLRIVFATIYIAGGIFCLALSIYIFPILAKLDCNVRQLIKNAFLFAVSQFPKTILFLVLALIPFAVLAFAPNWFIRLFPLWLLAYFSLVAGIKAGLLKKLFSTL
ncbi:MAG: DUF624 domain-containing protein [Anaerolineaceae bacterium]|nr:DUF624 domain-containing protein [Anaerolineaceae bacterium]